MDLTIQNSTGSEEGKLSVSASIFEREYNEGLVHQVVTAYLAGQRTGCHAQKTRSEVRGGGAKPWRQKGTGRARSGSIRSPIWKGGGRAFAAKNRDYSVKVNKKMRRAAMQAILSELIRCGRLVVVESIELNSHKTGELAGYLDGIGHQDVLIVTSDVQPDLVLASRNIPNVDVLHVDQLDPVSLIRHANVLMTVSSIKAIEEKLA